MKSTFLKLLISGAAAALIVGCSSSSDPVVAVIDGEEIPVSMINNYFERAGYVFESPEEEYKAKRDALDSLIEYKLFVKGAYDAGLHRDPEIDRLVVAERSTFLYDELYRQEVGSKIAVTDPEVDEFYERMKKERRIAHILVQQQALADSIRRELDTGADFAPIARELSVDYSSAVNGGDVGYITWGNDIVEEFRQAAFSLRVGETSQPIQTDYGWHIIRVLDERPAPELAPKKQLDPMIKQAMLARKSTEAEREFIETVEHRAAIEVNPEATQMLLEKLKMFFPDTLGGVPRPDNYFPNMDLLKPFEQQMVFASYLGGELTVEQYIKLIENVPQVYRPRFDNFEGLKKLIFQLQLRDIMEYEADRRNIGRSEEYQRRVTTYREGLMADKFQRQVLGRNITVTEDEIIEYYNMHLEDFIQPAQYQVYEIEQPTFPEAEKVLARLHEGANFEKLAEELTTRAGYKERKGDLGFLTPTRLPRLYDAARGLDPGKVSAPILNDENRYSIIKVVDVKPERVRPVEEMSVPINSRIIEMRRSSAATDWVRAERARSQIEIFESAIENTIDRSRYATSG